MVNSLIDTSASTVSSHFLVPAYIPDRDLGELFIAVQTTHVFKDSKTFVDCTPNKDPALILADYEKEKANDEFSLELFVHTNFTLPPVIEIKRPNGDKDMLSHLRNLWPHLTMSSKSEDKYTSLISLPYPFVVPGGRFREMFYWDSYFTMIGLFESGHDSLAMGMLRNMAYLVTTFGHIPNGNRTYFLSRSEPPFFAEMIKEYGEKHGMETVMEFLPALELEYNYWTKDNAKVDADNTVTAKSVWIDGGVLNRYTGTLNTPRAEAYDKEYGWAQALDAAERPTFHQNLRAACESGWDFSSRWFADGKTKTTVQCENLIPVCLNCLLYNCELQLAVMYNFTGNVSKTDTYKQLAETRKAKVLEHCWVKEAGLFNDYNFMAKSMNEVVSLVTVYPLFFGLATQQQAEKVATLIAEKFLVTGGVVTTPIVTGEQWDAPNGWAPLQWLTVIGLSKYGFNDLAKTIANRWLNTNEALFNSEQKMTEKYNVIDPSYPSGGGNYENQDGFGWTNGVALALHAWLQKAG